MPRKAKATVDVLDEMVGEVTAQKKRGRPKKIKEQSPVEEHKENVESMSTRSIVQSESSEKDVSKKKPQTVNRKKKAEAEKEPLNDEQTEAEIEKAGSRTDKLKQDKTIAFEDPQLSEEKTNEKKKNKGKISKTKKGEQESTEEKHGQTDLDTNIMTVEAVKDQKGVNNKPSVKSKSKAQSSKKKPVSGDDKEEVNTLTNQEFPDSKPATGHTKEETPFGDIMTIDVAKELKGDNKTSEKSKMIARSSKKKHESGDDKEDATPKQISTLTNQEVPDSKSDNEDTITETPFEDSTEVIEDDVIASLISQSPTSTVQNTSPLIQCPTVPSVSPTVSTVSADVNINSNKNAHDSKMKNIVDEGKDDGRPVSCSSPMLSSYQGENNGELASPVADGFNFDATYVLDTEESATSKSRRGRSALKHAGADPNSTFLLSDPNGTFVSYHGSKISGRGKSLKNDESRSAYMEPPSMKPIRRRGANSKAEIYNFDGNENADDLVAKVKKESKKNKLEDEANQDKMKVESKTKKNSDKEKKTVLTEKTRLVDEEVEAGNLPEKETKSSNRKKLKQVEEGAVSPEVDKNSIEDRKVPVKKRREIHIDLKMKTMMLEKTMTKGNKYIGAHVSIVGGLYKAVLEAVKIGARAFGMFLKGQRTYKSKPLDEADAEVFKNTLKGYGFSPSMVVPHGAYLMNCGSSKPEILDKSRSMLIDELQRCDMLGLDIFNFHPGSSCGEISTEDSIERIAESINMALDRSTHVTAVIENMSCQGHTVGGKFSDLASIIERVDDKSRIGVCLDTCHTFAAGYDISTPEGYDKTMAEFDEIVGFKYLKAVHLNDSKGKLGCHKDAHENIGEGHLGLETFQRIMNDPRFDGIPMILETPECDYSQEVLILNQMIN